MLFILYLIYVRYVVYIVAAWLHFCVKYYTVKLGSNIGFLVAITKRFF